MMWNPVVRNPNTNCDMWWDHRAKGYPVFGPPGLTVLFEKRMGREVNTLLWRNKNGELKGIFHHYPKAIPFFKMAEEVEVTVNPDSRRQGIGMLLIKEAIDKWDIQAKKQRYNEASAGLTDKWLREYREDKI